MSNKRHKHKKLPDGGKLGEIYGDRIWVIHPTKGLRSRSNKTDDVEIPNNTLGRFFTYAFLKKRGNLNG